jgi:hypothetical protein
MKKMYLLLITFSISVMSGCGVLEGLSYKSINRLKENTVPFNSLPIELKGFIDSISNMPNAADIELITLNTFYKYEFQDIGMFSGRSDEMWTASQLLVDKTNNISYRLSLLGNIPTPIIIFDREIFIPTDFNIFTTYYGELESMDFNRYLLDNDRRYRRIARKNQKKNALQLPPQKQKKQ